MTEPERIRSGVALSFPANDGETSSPPSSTKVLPRRLRRRLILEAKSPPSAEEIDAKLKEADLRRQQFYELVSSRARSKLSPSRHSQEEVLGQQLEATLNAAEEKRCWRQFVKLRNKTSALAEAFVALEINEESVKSMPFELLALKIESPASIQIVKALADCLESHFRISRATTSGPSSLDNIEHLLRYVASSSRRHANNPLRGGVKAIGSSKQAHQNPVKMSRYPARVVLCAYMIIGHPNAVFSGKGELEIALYESAVYFNQQFEKLIKIIIDGYTQAAQGKIASATPSRETFSSQLETFDEAWCSYLFRFVSWKVKDAKLLEKDLMGAARLMEHYGMQTHKPNSKGNDGALTHHLKDIKKQAILHNPSDKAGLECMQLLIPDAHLGDLEVQKSGSSLPCRNTSSSGSPNSPDDTSGTLSGEISGIVEECERSIPEIQSSLEKEVFSPRVESVYQSSRTAIDLSSSATLFSENEMLVNEIIHEQHHDIADSLVIGDEDQNSLKAKVREAMEKAFWDAVMESMKQDEPDLSWILKLMKEVRDELCEMSPQSLRQEIVDTIDIDVVSQVLTSGISDTDFLGKILEFSLVTLQKLSAPADDDEIRATRLKLFKELAETSQAGNISEASFAFLMVKGLRSVLQQIQNLKKEISKARLRMVEPVIKGPAGLEYLKNSFARLYGSPVDAPTSLPLTKQWLSSVRIDVEREWDEHIDSLSALTTSNAGFSQVVPSTTLRTGGRTLMASRLDSVTSSATGNEQPECKGERMDMLVRLGLLKLASEVGGMVLETVPETLKLNFLRLRSIQSQLQKIIVVSISVLVLRQALLSETLVASSVDMEDIISRCSEKLFSLLDNVEDAGMAEIIDAICAVSESYIHLLDAEKLQSRKQVIANMLVKSMQAGDAIFTRVSQTIYLATRGAAFGGSGVKGRKLVEAALRRIGAAHLTDKVMKVAKVLIVIAVISCGVHGDWYQELLKPDPLMDEMH